MTSDTNSGIFSVGLKSSLPPCTNGTNLGGSGDDDDSNGSGSDGSGGSGGSGDDGENGDDSSSGDGDASITIPGSSTPTDEPTATQSDNEVALTFFPQSTGNSKSASGIVVSLAGVLFAAFLL